MTATRLFVLLFIFMCVVLGVVVYVKEKNLSFQISIPNDDSLAQSNNKVTTVEDTHRLVYAVPSVSSSSYPNYSVV